MTLLEIVGLISGIATICAFLLTLRVINKGDKALEAKCLKLEQQLERSEKQHTETLNAVREYNDRQIERQQQEIDRLHDGLDSLGIGLLKLQQSEQESLTVLAEAKKIGEAFKRMDSANKPPTSPPES